MTEDKNYLSSTPPVRLAVEPNPRLRTYCPPLHKELELFLSDLVEMSRKESTDG